MCHMCIVRDVTRSVSVSRLYALYGLRLPARRREYLSSMIHRMRSRVDVRNSYACALDMAQGPWNALLQLYVDKRLTVDIL